LILGPIGVSPLCQITFVDLCFVDLSGNLAHWHVAEYVGHSFACSPYRRSGHIITVSVSSNYGHVLSVIDIPMFRRSCPKVLAKRAAAQLQVSLDRPVGSLHVGQRESLTRSTIGHRFASPGNVFVVCQTAWPSDVPTRDLFCFVLVLVDKLQATSWRMCLFSQPTRPFALIH
jgi:hypothetical protein